MTERIFSSGPLTVDREKGIVRGVKILGESSANGRDYPAATRRAAQPILEGAKVNINHPSKPGDPRAFEDRFAIIRDVKDTAQGTFGDLHFNPKHQVAEQFIWWAVNEPSAIGLSINAAGKVKRRGGRDIVEEITRVDSVDLVSDPATTNGLFEQKNMSAKTIKAALQEAWKEKLMPRDKWLAIIEEEIPASMTGADMPAPESGSNDVDGAFKAMICGVFDDSSLDTAGKISKIKEILKAHEKLTAAPAPEPETPKEEPAAEGKKPKTEGGDVKQLREELAIRDLLADSGLVFAKPEARKAFAKSLLPLSESERKELIEERKAQQAQGDKQSGKTRSGGYVPLAEQRAGQGGQSLVSGRDGVINDFRR